MPFFDLSISIQFSILRGFLDPSDSDPALPRQNRKKGTQKHQNNTFFNTRIIQIAKFPEISHLFTNSAVIFFPVNTYTTN